MKTRSVITAMVILLMASVALNVHFAVRRGDSTTSGSNEAEKQLWTCGMHPNVVMDHPDNCPICGMKLTPMKSSGSSAAASQSISIDPTTRQNMAVRTATVTRRDLARTVRASGVVTVNEAGESVVNLRFSGWIEKLHVNRTGESIRRGDPLFDVYSPELVSAQREYLVARQAANNSAPAPTPIHAAARDRLLNWGLTEAQLRELDARGEPARILTIVSPASGVIMSRSVIEGASVAAGTDLLTIADLSTVWVQAQLYEYELPWVSAGLPARVSLPHDPERVLAGQVSFIYPYLDPQTRTATIRLAFGNPDFLLKPDMYVDVDIVTRPKTNTLAIPREAVVRSGRRDIVFVGKGEGEFEPREVKVGLEADDFYYEILAGLKEGERIVTSAQFLLDSESQLQEALLKMSGGSPIAHVGHGDADASRAAHASSASGGASQPARHEASGATMDAVFTSVSLYRCPAHHEIVSPEPNATCPLCQVPLEKMSDAELRGLRDSHPYGCVMCPVVVSEAQKDKRCPICEMKLTPIEKPAAK